MSQARLQVDADGVLQLAGELDFVSAPLLREQLLAAVEAAKEEAAYAAGLCDHPAGTMLAIEREFTDEGVAERIKVVPKQDEGAHARIWSVVEDEG